MSGRTVGEAARIDEAYTPGPWRVYDAGWLGPVYVLDVTGDHIAKAAPMATPEETVANARLLAAAPELLAALKKVVAIADRKTVEFDRARAAIAKAEGRDS